jgi:SOS-response transcriptional repressor LexA
MTTSSTTGPTLEVWQALSKLSEEKEYPPSIREISDLCGGMSTSQVSRHLDRLAEAEVIARYPGISRGIRLLRKPEF